MMEQIKISGGTSSEISKNHFQYKIEITDIQDSTQISFSDLPPITLYRDKPMNFDVDHSYLKDKNALFIHAKEYGKQLLVSDQEDQVVIVFPEAMWEVWPTNNEGIILEGQWLDERRFKIPLNEKETEVSLLFPTLYSKLGNYPEPWDHHLRIIRKPKGTWYDYVTEHKVGWEATDRFFDGLIFSPDCSKYVGLVALGGGFGDGSGKSYSFILQQQNQEPQIIENVFYSTVDIMGSPIQWLDNQRILYASYYGIYIYDTESGDKQSVYEMEGNRTVNHTVYDPFRHKIYAIIDSGIADDLSVERWTYDLKNPIPKMEANFTNAVLWEKYSSLELRIHPLKEGIYWTKTVDDDVRTEFITAGHTYQADGFVTAILDQGVILQDGESFGAEDRNFMYYYWIPGQQPIRLPESPERYMSSFGRYWISYDDQRQQYYIYEPKTNEWVRLFENANDVFLQPQGFDALYRFDH